MPRVSVIIPVFNAAATVRSAVESALAQTFTDREIVAVDDGSSDGSLDILRSYQPQIRVLQRQHGGPSAARNLGIANSSGEYLGFLDADDLWMRDFLAKTVAVLESDPACVLVYTDLKLADSQGKELGTTLIGARGVPTVKDMLDELWPILPSSVVVRRRALERAGGYPEQLTSFEDVYLWLLLREQGEFRYLEEPLALWRFSLFPSPLKPAGGQEAAGRIFDRMVFERYGVSGGIHVKSRARAPRSILAYIGLRALAAGDRAGARRALGRALRIDPWRFKNYLRFARTFLPPALARALSSRTGRAA